MRLKLDKKVSGSFTRVSRLLDCAGYSLIDRPVRPPATYRRIEIHVLKIDLMPFSRYPLPRLIIEWADDSFVYKIDKMYIPQFVSTVVLIRRFEEWQSFLSSLVSIENLP